MNDIKFVEFEQWAQQQKNKWEEIDLHIRWVNYDESKYRHSYCILLSNSRGGEAKLILYESNLIYWVDYEAWNGVSDDVFVMTVLEYGKTSDLEKAEKQFFEYMNLSEVLE